MVKTPIKNPNAPGKGANVTVDPIRHMKDIRASDENAVPDPPRLVREVWLCRIIPTDMNRIA